MEKLKIADISVTQFGLRAQHQIPSMIQYISSGGIFDQQSLEQHSIFNPASHKSPIIQISRFEDQSLYIADGHHRIYSIYLAGRDFLYPCEYQIKDWTYQSYLEIDFPSKWVTPFNPKTEIRCSNFLKYKKLVYQQLELSEQSAIDFIKNNFNMYARQRDIWNIKEILNKNTKDQL